ncbi:MAG: serine/threonine protein kinase, partial [bacterium]|nr:serine/threonine protein kinase [bacterium]
PTDDFEAGERVGRYRLEKRIGRGGMGIVWLGWDQDLERPVAMKFPTPEQVRLPRFRRSFLDEARAAAMLDHPHICPIFDVGELPERGAFFAMPFYSGGTLADRLGGGRLPIGEAIRFAREICEGLACAHESGIVHCDIKPRNILLSAAGQVKIADFGIARLRGRQSEGVRAGTLAYMAPERIGSDEFDGRADLWSVGVVLFEMLTGQTPFRG